MLRKSGSSAAPDFAPTLLWQILGFLNRGWKQLHPPCTYPAPTPNRSSFQTFPLENWTQTGKKLHPILHGPPLNSLNYGVANCRAFRFLEARLEATAPTCTHLHPPCTYPAHPTPNRTFVQTFVGAELNTNWHETAPDFAPTFCIRR